MFEPREAFILAARDYRWLLDGGYPDKASLSIVGDRHRLSRDERVVLFRGVASAVDSEARMSAIRGSTDGRPLYVDAFNQAFVVMHYLSGRPVFVASDGLTRDAGGSRGRIADPALFARSMALLARAIAAAGPSSVALYFDAPVPDSARLAFEAREAFLALGIETESFVEKSADFALKAAPDGGRVASGDSAIAQALARRALPSGPGIFDAARLCIEREFPGRAICDISAFLAPG